MLTVLVFTSSIEFVPMQMISLTGMVAGNAIAAVRLYYNQLGLRFHSEQQI